MALGRSTMEYQLSLSEWDLKYLISEVAWQQPIRLEAGHKQMV